MKNKTMDKIEKLELEYDDWKRGLSLGSREIHIIIGVVLKVNEIIDILNSRLFEPIITVHNQSQKQPEGDYVNTEPEKVIVDPIGVDFTTEGKNREFPVEYKTREEIDKMFKPVKQDEWKERLAKYLKGTEYALWYGNEWDLSDEVEEFISQLLSERTFTKKELEIIDWYLQEYGTPEGVDKEADKLREKVSKLLKEENER